METSINVNRYGNKTGISTGGQAGNPIQFLPGGIPNPEANRAETSAYKESPYSVPAPSVALYKDWNSSINSNSLTPSTPFNLPNIPASTTANAVTGETQATIDQFSRQLAQDQANKQAELSGSKTILTDLQNQIQGIQGQRPTLEKNAGLDTLNTTIADLTNSLEASQKAQREELKAVNGLGLTDIQKNQKINEINRAYGIQNSDTMFALNQYQRRYDAAVANIDRKIKLQLEPLETKLQFAQQFYNDNKEAFNKADERAFQNLLTTTNRAYEEARANKTAIGNIQIEALKNGVNIPLSVINQLNTAKTPNEAYTILQANGINLVNPAEQAYKYAQAAKMNAESRISNSGLPAQVQTRVQSVASQFDNEQAVKNYQTIAETVDAVKNAGNTPTDDIQRIYGVAKVFDPNSAVREGEYKTVQDYATSLLQRAGLKANRVFNNDGFLTPEARKFINDTLDNRLASSKKAYQNIYDSYGERINKITGAKDGNQYITDYSAAFKNKILISPDGTQQVDISELTPEQIKEAENAGWK